MTQACRVLSELGEGVRRRPPPPELRADGDEVPTAGAVGLRQGERLGLQGGGAVRCAGNERRVGGRSGREASLASGPTRHVASGWVNQDPAVCHVCPPSVLNSTF